MSDLGLDSLTDDQLLSLLQEVVGELIVRDPALPRAAQVEVSLLKAKRDLFISTIERMVMEERTRFEVVLRSLVAQEVREAIGNGEIRCEPDSTMQARIIFEATKNEIKMQFDAQLHGQEPAWQHPMDGLGFK